MTKHLAKALIMDTVTMWIVQTRMIAKPELCVTITLQACGIQAQTAPLFGDIQQTAPLHGTLLFKTVVMVRPMIANNGNATVVISDARINKNN